MANNYILDEDRNPQLVSSVVEWANWFETADRRVAHDKIGEATISTVFLGIDYNFGDGPPLLFETMIFGGEHDDYQERCSTWAEAEAQHEEACRIVGGEPSARSPNGHGDGT